MGGGLVRAAVAVPLFATLVGSAAPDPSETWRALTIESRPATAEEPPHLEALHEWWFFTVQNPGGGGGCGRWQAMVAFVADREALADTLLFTTVVEEVPAAHTRDFAPGAMRRSHDAYTGTEVVLGDSEATHDGGAWAVDARGAGARLVATFSAAAPLWYRRAPEGGGLIELTFAARASVSGSLTVGARTCPVSGAGYYEHVWGSWSRLPQWGVDYLNAHAGGWSAYARLSRPRGETNLYPFLGQDPNDYYPPVLIVTDGVAQLEARQVTFTVVESDTVHPELGVKVPGRYRVVGSGFDPPGVLTVVELDVRDPVLATIYFSTTSSGILEGWGHATLTVDGATLAGTSEIEFQRFGTRYPH